MKFFLTALIALVCLSATLPASAQGLLGIGKGESGSDLQKSNPLRFTVGVEGGYDSNVTTAPDGEEEDSFYIGAGIGASYALATKVSRLEIGGSFNTFYYLDTGDADDELFYNARLTANLTHQISRRVSFSNTGYIAYEVEPDYLIGASVSLRDDQYLYGYNRASMSFQLTNRLSTVSHYTISGIQYEDSVLGRQEDRLSHLIGQQVRYSLNRVTTATAEYRFGIVNFQSAPNDSISHYALAGLEHQFSPYTTGTVAAGAEYRDFDRYDSLTRPYGEASLRYKLTDDTTLSWLGRVGLEDSELGDYHDRYSYRTGLVATHGFTPRVRGTLGVSYVHSEFDARGDSDLDDLSDDAVSLQLGVSYRIYQNVDLNAGYTYTTIYTGDSLRDYDRHRANVGVSSTF